MTVMNTSTAAQCVAKFKQADNKTSSHVFGKCVFSRCDESFMGTDVCFLFGRHTISNAIGA